MFSGRSNQLIAQQIRGTAVCIHASWRVGDPLSFVSGGQLISGIRVGGRGGVGGRGQ